MDLKQTLDFPRFLAVIQGISWGMLVLSVGIFFASLWVPAANFEKSVTPGLSLLAGMSWAGTNLLALFIPGLGAMLSPDLRRDRGLLACLVFAAVVFTVISLVCIIAR